MNIKVVKMLSKLIVLLILFVVLFLISAFLYSARYWHDIYNYLTPNITITRIHSISELNYTIYEIGYTTENYSTTDWYDISTTEDYVFDTDFGNFSNFFDDEFDSYLLYKNLTKRDVNAGKVNEDYSLLPNKTVIVDYFLDYDTAVSDGVKVKSLIDEEMEVNEGINKQRRNKMGILPPPGSTGIKMPEDPSATHVHGCRSDLSNESATVPDVTHPWIVAIYLRNKSNNEFSYICDGAILSNKSVLTAAQCVMEDSRIVDNEDLLLITGKESLQVIGNNEKVYKVRNIKVHENFTYIEGFAANDLAIVYTKEAIELGVSAQSVCLLDGNYTGAFTEEFTTGWAVDGSLINIPLKSTDQCHLSTEGLYCMTYKNDVNGCPSYGGVHEVNSGTNGWLLKGMLTKDKKKQLLYCTQQGFVYTSLERHTRWLMENENYNT